MEDMMSVAVGNHGDVVRVFYDRRITVLPIYEFADGAVIIMPAKLTAPISLPPPRSEPIGKIGLDRRRYERMRAATPAWSCKAAIDALKKEARRMTVRTRKPHVVDHIVPLQGKNVCGLHVAENMRVIQRRANFSKYNHFDDSILVGLPGFIPGGRPPSS